MTIALGILATDGVVIAADTQETYGHGYAKYDTRKIVSPNARPTLLANRLNRLRYCKHHETDGDGCGRGTHVTVLRDGGAWYVTEAAMERLEDVFRRYTDVEVSVIRSMAGFAHDYAEAKAFVEALNDSAKLAECDLIETRGEAVFE